MNANLTIGNGIQPASGDVRVAAGGVRLVTRPMWPNSLSTFLEAILGWYQGRMENRQGLGLVFRQAQCGVVLQTAYHRTQLQWAPRLHLAMLVEAATSEPSPSVLQLTVHGERIEAVDPTGRHPAADAAAYPAQHPRRLRPVRKHSPPPLPPVPRTVQRTAPIGTTGASPLAADTMRGRAAGPGAPPTVADGVSSTAKPIDVGRLADEVIRTIDRRIIARRERLGRT